MKNTGSVTVSWDFSNGDDKAIMLVGEQKNGVVDVINAFQGDEAKRIYSLLVPEHFCPLCGARTLVHGYCRSCSEKQKVESEKS